MGNTFTTTPVSPPPAVGPAIASLQQEITTMLGSNTLDVEVTSDDLVKCITDALRVLNREHPPTAWATVTGGMTRVGVIACNAPGIYGIIDVDFAYSPNNLQSQYNPFIYDDPVMLAGMMSGRYFGHAGEIVQQLTYIKTIRDIAGMSPDWETRWQRNTDGTQTLLLIVSDLPQLANIMYEYVYHLTPDDNPYTGVANIPSNDVDWVVRYATARAKQILGRVLRKFGGGVNMPDGGTEQLDGGELVQEGLNEQAELTQLIHQRRRNVLPRSG